MSTRDRPSSRASLSSRDPYGASHQRPQSSASQYSTTSASSSATNATQQYSAYARKPIQLAVGGTSTDAQRLGGLSHKQHERVSVALAAAKNHGAAVTIRTTVPVGYNERPQAVGRSVDSDQEGDEADQTAVLSDAIPSKGKRPPSLRQSTADNVYLQAPLKPRVVSGSSPKRNLARSFTYETVVPSNRSSPIPVDIQEALLVEDLLNVLMGIEGEHITFDPDYLSEDQNHRLKGASHVIDSSFSTSLSDLASRVLPLAQHYSSVSAYVENQSDLDRGLTNHALGAALRDQLQAYLVLVAQLQHHFATSSNFTLQKLWLYVQDMMHELAFIYTLVQELVKQPSAASPDSDASNAEDSDSDSDSDLDLSGPGAEGLKAVLGQMKAKHSAKSTWNQGGIVKGCEVIAVIDELLQKSKGDPTAQRVYSDLLLKASQPFREMLLKWISTGKLDDPYDEFIIRETKSITRGSLEVDYVDEYWERRYTLKDMPLASSGSPTVTSNRPYSLSQSASRLAARQDGRGGGAIVPSFLEEWKAKILLAGKYLNVIRECGVPVEMSAEVSAEARQCLPMNDAGFFKRIDDAYALANQTLLRMLIDKEQLPLRLRSIKHYFFIDQGDFFTHFLDLATHELSKKTKHISLTKLQTLLDLAIRNPSSASSNDPFKEDVKVGIMATTLADMLMRIVSVSGALPTGGAPETPDIDLASKKDEANAKEKKEALTGIEAFTLEYSVTFPLSLVISRKTILKYQMVFRHLLQLRNLEHHLTNVWLEQTKSPIWRKRSIYPELEQWKMQVTSLRSRMLVYLKEMYDFATHMVLEPNWRTLQNRLLSADTVDQMLQDHADFLDTCLKTCMLTNDEMIQVQQKLVHCINLFITYSSHFSKMAASAAVDLEVVAGDWNQIDTDSMERTIGKIESFFSHWVTLHCEKINFIATSSDVALIALYQRLAPLKRKPEA